MKSFALIGTAGYVAPRHLKAIYDIGGKLIASFDPHDSVGILDHYFPDSQFFTDYSRFERFLYSSSGMADEKIDYVSICSPNYLHDTQIRMALNSGADVICEKPLVINPWNLDALELIQEKAGKKVFSVMQLRYHPALIALKNQLQYSKTSPAPYKVKLTYITKRGNWYHYSWKGDEEKSGGIVVNIGIHLFDLLIWLFGPVKESLVFIRQNDKVKGRLEFENATVEWFLSIDGADLPQSAIINNSRTFRSLTIDGQEINFTDGFTDLHTEVYRRTLAGEGLSISDARPSIELTHSIRTSKITTQ